MYKTERPYFANNGPAVETRNPDERSDSCPIALLTGIVRDCVGAKPLAMLRFEDLLLMPLIDKSIFHLSIKCRFEEPRILASFLNRLHFTGEPQSGHFVACDEDFPAFNLHKVVRASFGFLEMLHNTRH